MKRKVLLLLILALVGLMVIRTRKTADADRVQATVPGNGSKSRALTASASVSESATVTATATATASVPAPSSLREWVDKESHEMNRLQEDPAAIGQRLDQAAKTLSGSQIRYLVQIAASPAESENARFLALTLLTRAGSLANAELLGLLARPSIQGPEFRRRLEGAINIKILQHLENQALQNPAITRKLGELASRTADRGLREQITRTLSGIANGEPYWTQKIASLKMGAPMEAE